MNSNTDETHTQSAKRSPFAGMKRTIFALGLLVVVWFVFGQIVPRFVFKDELPPTEESIETTQQENLTAYDTEKLRALEDRVNQLEAKLKTYEELISAPKAEVETTPPPSVTDESIKAWQAEIEAKISQLHVPPAASSIDESRLEALEARVNNQQQSFAQIQMQADEKISIITALSQLRELLLGGEPYHAPLAQIAALSMDNSEAQKALKVLNLYAQNGISTPDELAAEFSKLIPKTLDQTAAKSFAGNIRTLVTIRKVGEPEGTHDEAILARAETNLARSDIAGALGELAALSKPASEVLTAWIAKANAYEQARSSMMELQRVLSTPRTMPEQATTP